MRHGGMIRRLVSSALLAACSSLAFAQVPAAVAVGVAGPLTGPAAPYGQDLKRGAEMAVDDVNASNITINGKPLRIELISQDDQGDPRTAVQVAQRLIDSGVVGVVGHTTSGPSLAASAVYQRAGLVMIVPSSSNPTITKQGFTNVYRVYGTDNTLADRAGAYISGKLAAKRVAIVDDRTAYGQGLADALEAKLKANGVTSIDREFTNDQAVDFRPIITTIRGNRADAIFFAGLGQQGALFVKQARQLAYRGVLMAGVTFVNDTFLKIAGSSAEGMYAFEQGIPLTSVPSGQMFAKKFKARFGSETVGYAVHGYDGVWTLINAMKRAGTSTDKAKLVFTVRELNFEGILGNISFDGAGDLKKPLVSLYQVENGKWKVVGGT